MAMLISALMFVPLLALAIANLLWSMGRTWPIRNAQLLAQTVIGTPGITRMPPKYRSLAVAIIMLAAGVLALALADPAAGGVWLSLAGIFGALLFVARGVLGYTASWRARFPEEPFATLDRKNYSPLSLFIGAGYVALVLMRLF